jgi:hypothetical protein
MKREKKDWEGTGFFETRIHTNSHTARPDYGSFSENIMTRFSERAAGLRFFSFPF